MQGHGIDTTEHRLFTANKAASMALQHTTLEAKRKEGLAVPLSSPYLLYNNYCYTCTATSNRSSLRALTVNVKITNKTERKDRQ
jgi:hypothetical protein